MFNISYSPQFNLSVKQKFLFPKVPKNHPKFTQNRKTLVNVLSRGIWRCLKRERDIGGKAMLSDVKTAYPTDLIPQIFIYILVDLLVRK